MVDAVLEVGGVVVADAVQARTAWAVGKRDSADGGDGRVRWGDGEGGSGSRGAKLAPNSKEKSKALRVRTPEVIPRLLVVFRRCQAEAAAIGGAGGEEGWVGGGVGAIVRRGCDNWHGYGGCKGEVRDAHDRSGRGDAARQPGRGQQLGASRIDRDAALVGHGSKLVQLKVAGAIRGRRLGVHRSIDVVDAVLEVSGVVVADAVQARAWAVGKRDSADGGEDRVCGVRGREGGSSGYRAACAQT